MPAYREPNPEDVELLKSLCSQSEIAAVSRVTRFDLVEIFRAQDTVLVIYTHPEKNVLSRRNLAVIHCRLKFELGIHKVVRVELLDKDLEGKVWIKLIAGSCTDRKFIPVYTRIANAIVRPYLHLRRA